MSFTHRPTIRGRQFMAASGHYLATAAGIKMLESGGNAADAGAAMGLAINVVQPESNNLGGVAPTLVYERGAEHVWQVSGLGHYPRGATIEWFREKHEGRIPAGIPATVTPAALGSWVTTLARFGTKTFAEAGSSALGLAGAGFPADAAIVRSSERLAADDAASTYLREVFAPGGKALTIGEPFIQADLARAFELLIEAEGSAGGDRTQGLQAVLDRFYRGDIAASMAEFNQSEGGVLTADDVAAHRNRIGPAPATTYRGHRVFACGPWCQGPVVLQALNILEGYEVTSWPPGGIEWLHHVVQALNAAFADRHAFYGDPEFVRVPLDGLLDKAYAATWRERIDDRAFSKMPPPGDPWAFETGENQLPAGTAQALEGTSPPDTTYLCVVDHEGNAVSATPSDGAAASHSAMVPGLGFVVSDRGNQGWVEESHPSAVAPGKRPRLTPNPGLVLWSDGRVMPYGTPGGDVQTQAMTQVLLQLIDHGVDPQAALEAPRVWSENFPGSWDPHPYAPGVLTAEPRISVGTLNGLRERGHKVKEAEDWTASGGRVCLCRADMERGSYEGAADSRGLSYAMGW